MSDGRKPLAADSATTKVEETEKKPAAHKRVLGRWKRSRAGRKVAVVLKKSSTWRYVVFVGFVLSSVVLLMNVILLIWARTAHSDNLLFQGDCGRAKSIVTYSSLAINAVSTLLLGASNAAMQCLCGPMRSEVDRAHASGSWLDIGVSGVRNLRSIEPWRRCAWAVILISSLPLHLLYNSVIYSTSQANEYTAILVTDDFTRGTIPLVSAPDFNIGGMEDSQDDEGEILSVVNALQSDLLQFQRLENADCIKTFGTDYVTDFLNVLLVTTASSPTNESAFAYYEYHPSSNGATDDSNVLNYSWICNGNSPCDIPTQIQQASSWTFTFNKTLRYPISHCLAQPIAPKCTVEILPQVLGIVIACNLFKVACFATLLFNGGFRPLMLFGDAIASYMTTPDTDAVTCGPVSAETLRKMQIANPLRFATDRDRSNGAPNRSRRQTRLWHGARRRWASAVGPKRWAVTVLGFVILWFVGFAFLYTEQDQGSGIPFSTFWVQGFGTPYPLATLQLASAYPVIAVVILANLPQIVLSFVYLCYNDVFTCMMVSVEFLRHSAAHKGLRVTSPEGEQRGTYTLSLPLKVSIPLLFGAGLLHWAMSQSLFLARVNVIDPFGHVDNTASFSTLGWSALALLILLLVWGLMLVAVIAAGCRKFQKGAPVVGSNSRAIMCAAGFVGDGLAEAQCKVKYGVIGAVSEGYKRVGFTSGDAGELSEDEVYA